MRTTLTVLLFVGLLLAGCASPSTDDIDWDAVEAEIGTPLGDPAAPRGVNLEHIVTTNGRTDAAPPTESYAETAVKGDYAYLSRYGPEQGLVVFDISDPEAPVAVGSLGLDAGFEPDIEVSDDGMWGFWVTQRFPTSAAVPTTDPGANAPHGIHIIDLSDKTDPQWAGFTPVLPDGPHSITYVDLDGRHILLQSVYAFAYAYGGVAVPGTQRLVISELDTSLPVAQLTTLSEYILPEAEGNLGQMPHDVSIQKHPLTGQWLAYISYWDQGVVILDITDPATPAFVGQAKDFGPAQYGEIHMARPFDELIDGRHVTVAEPEIGSQPDTGYMTFFDTTDPAHPTYVSSWKIPGGSDSQGGALGPHYFDVQDGRVALAHYQAGVWIIDVHDKDNLEHPRTAGYAFQEAAGEGTQIPLGFGSAPNAFDAWWHGDHVFIGDIHGGLGVYKYTGPAPAVESGVS